MSCTRHLPQRDAEDRAWKIKGGQDEGKGIESSDKKQREFRGGGSLDIVKMEIADVAPCEALEMLWVSAHTNQKFALFSFS